ncbi:MAG TPA: patatin-like phospholipase family protein [Thermoanaerobaculia bacterium]|jgi:predicted acylesterase/phospholipase RssA|nr:patatin-like phospholipase family protein [Thermoanaerobaculia bacterium]
MKTPPYGTAALDFLRSARRVGYVFSGGSMRCAFQVGALETLRELGIRPALAIGVSAGAWNASAVAAGTDDRLRSYWRSFLRMPAVDLKNLLRAGSPFRYPEIHRRNFRRYIGAARLAAPGALPLYVGVTRLADRAPVLFEARDVADPFALLLASNYLPPFYTRVPRLNGERYGDGGLSDNLPYERAFEEGCDAVVVFANKGESEGGLCRSPRDSEHLPPADLARKMVVLRPRHRLSIGFVERDWNVVARTMEVGRLRAREVLLDERHPETDVRAEGRAPTAILAGLLLGRRRRPSD